MRRFLFASLISFEDKLMKLSLLHLCAEDLLFFKNFLCSAYKKIFARIEKRMQETGLNT